ncbi:MAG: hypothetical protein HKN25_16020 [Pyrinomonadaceae bacterium]|nr:hypothetical protein [Pyrinomonadaceae bacterium]
MSKTRNHNTVYFLTTLSVYLGLVLVGASPQVLAQTAKQKNSQTQRFEIRTNSSSVISKLKFKSKYKTQEVLPFSNSGIAPRSLERSNTVPVNRNSQIREDIDFFENNQVLTNSNLPRASL